jgi:hypothetical protein
MEKSMFYMFLEFIMQLGMVSLLVATFIVLQVLVSGIHSRRQHEEQDRLIAERHDNEVRRERRKSGERKAAPGRADKPLASLASVPMRRSAAKPAFGRKANI